MPTLRHRRTSARPTPTMLRRLTGFWPSRSRRDHDATASPAAPADSATGSAARANGAAGGGVLMGASGGLAPDGLARLVGPVHRDATRLTAWSTTPTPGADPRLVHRAGYAAVAAMCAHLDTMHRVVYPRVASALPHAEGRLAQLRAGAHDMLVTMQGIQQYAQGDTHWPSAAVSELRGDLATQISDHAREEESLLREFDGATPAAERNRLVAEYERMLPRAPSRPHPYLMRGRLAGPLGLFLARWDGVLDTMDSRVVLGTPVRAPSEVGRWGAWLLGQPPARESRPADVTRGQATSTGSERGPAASQPVTRSTSPRG
ncbi:hemerythrin domain-containing protein [Frankia sp. CNm7]|uniref:Hemerythrin domain-containing protein n=1 Tax=Frankia nepalensis TaxID=1836974 RepID=A0A937R9P9_9ACTN|nr:hemerythrin domain-containing protein [Frankia nepalensis]MBL7499634.1 hemerythrin domain-containing protein [Frankia nepalensis]MBL7515978.1 hemerythrin domain-containing protein [Frankia nepalensis]MBL7523654.1 hemerythrin domain-containing protein [Frankia nepalensis]MBL7628011.1 hemerythrin domain-containing protein [Frankia nepalensis]